MPPPSERIRRILSDAPPPPLPEAASPRPTANPNPNPNPDPAPNTNASPIPSRARALRERLQALGLGRSGGTRSDPTGRTSPRGDGECTWSAAPDDRPLEVQVDGASRETPLGTFLYAEKHVPLAALHGTRSLEGALARPIPLRAHETHAGGPRLLRATDAVFLDTETTGLAGGTGTVAFLVGTGRVEGDRFVVRQYCMRDFPEEPALLHALLADIGNAPLVTFNGRSFDWPLLTTRLSMHRMKHGTRAHYDLLPPARRLWVDSVDSHTLGTLEEQVLGLKRTGDLPGWRIPQAFFDYLRTGDGGLVALAFAHNVTDVVSMLALFGEVSAILEAPDEREGATARDHHGTARLLLDLGDEERAAKTLVAGIRRSPAVDGIPLRRLLGHLHRRAGRVSAALRTWEELARMAPHFDVEAFEQVAKIQEHRRRDYAQALAWVEEALVRVAAGSRAEECFRHRRQRLQRKQSVTGAAR